MNPNVLAAAVVISAIVLLANIGPSRAIKCYVCASTTHGGCTKEDFKSDEITELDDCTYCQKSVTSVSSVETTTRTCVPACTEGGGGVSGLSSHTYCCKDKDLCNGAVQTASQLTMIAVALVCGIAAAARLF